MDRFKQSIYEQASSWLSDLLNAGFIDSPFKPFDQRKNYIGYFEWFLSVGKEKLVWDDPKTFNLSTAAQSTRWQVSHLPTRTHPDVANYWAVELAQFAVPIGHVGFVQCIEQVVNDVTGSYYPTNVSFWGSPRFVDPDVDNLRYYLTISEFYGTLPARFELNSAVAIPIHALPGHPYPDLPIIDGLWYPAHNNKSLKLIVPGRHVLRLFLVTPPTVTYQWEVSGRFSGSTQSTYQNCAVINARELY